MLTAQNILRREAGSAAYVCLSCRLKAQARSTSTLHQRNATESKDGVLKGRRGPRAGKREQTDTHALRPACRRPLERPRFARRVGGALSHRAYHASSRSQQQAEAAALQNPPGPPPDLSGYNPHAFMKTGGIRDQLRRWQELHGKELDANYKVLEQVNDSDLDDASNNLTRLPDPSRSLQAEADREEEEQRSIEHFSRTPESDDALPVDTRFLQMGDLIELEFPSSERESIIAVFISRAFTGSQILTMHGRWMIIPERSVQYSIPGWVSPKLVEPVIPYLPNPQSMEDYEALKDRAYMQDLSVPRTVANPLVSRMVQFHTESQEIYRKHSRALDNAHDILGHATDLRYGSLMSAATTLLKMRPADLPVTALFTVRKALSTAGFAFNIDRRSHRLTGYLQIRSKEQCRMVETVRDWLREWQDDMAVRAPILDDERALRKHKTKKGANIVYSFLEKVRRIVTESRKHRDPTICGAVGPSKKRFPIAPGSEAVRTEIKEEFDDNDTELVRFVEAWACSNMFVGLPRLESLPPLLIHATGMYENYRLIRNTGFLLLQELGTVMPYENRVRFDQHLLLPSSQHSKPLQNLMSSLMNMANTHNFQDSMTDMRHDFGDLPVYCIDDASAHEIDDGISVESAGNEQWWAHIHIANPTAFFNRDHPLAKMARHMGESIYMPERTYMMLPRWATKKHFSLGNDRPTLTFSVKMDSEGNTLEHKVRAGFIRNVLRLTHSEIISILEEEGQGSQHEMKEVIVGGEVPAPRASKGRAPNVTTEMKKQLQALQLLAAKREAIRKANGGVFFNIPAPNVEVYQAARGSGLAWDHPWRRGSRIVEGDPVIKLSSSGFRNWFSPTQGVADILVKEMMLLACETSAKWCAERKIPAIFRGTVVRPDTPDSEEYLQNVVLPAAAKEPSGEYPMHLGVKYMQMLGSTALSTKPTRHKTLGMNHYGKVTSPLRRYGDMILHWQIEAALREEARTGRSLVTDDENADRSFLPFSAPVLDTIALGLQPREKLITKAKIYADQFWTAMCLFRAFHYGEAKIPWQPVPEPPFHSNPGVILPPKPPQNYNCHVFISSPGNYTNRTLGCQNIEMNVAMAMERPEAYGLSEAQQGDVWECNVLYVDCYIRTPVVRPVRLVHRAEE